VDFHRNRAAEMALVFEPNGSISADEEDLELYSAEIQRVRDRIADVVKSEGVAGRPTA
jgi:hypothetical protein